ncbi:hypothetical protein ACFVRD_06655 [Streptomyces sp. NPDC057908]|uniref:hypothetical protein n=1 Tax=unclassified Streptomyces TaxID=2593676 RepID=UPI002E0D89D6|nr:hypothetical protein OG609_33520 [Streptomyces sp. NBC_01224]
MVLSNVDAHGVSRAMEKRTGRRTENVMDDRTPERIVTGHGVGELPVQESVLIAKGAWTES